MLSMNYGKLTQSGAIHWIISKFTNDYLIRDQTYEDRLLFNRTTPTCFIGIPDFQGEDFGTFILDIDFIGKREERLLIQVLQIGKKIG